VLDRPPSLSRLVRRGWGMTRGKAVGRRGGEGRRREGEHGERGRGQELGGRREPSLGLTGRVAEPPLAGASPAGLYMESSTRAKVSGR